MIDKLLVKAEYFEKISGVLQAPPSMVKQINHWAAGIYYTKIYEKLKRAFEENHDKYFLEQIAFIKKNIPVKYENPKTFKVKLDDLPYFKDEESKEYLENFFLNLKCFFITSQSGKDKIYSEENWNGLWEPGKLYVYYKIPEAEQIDDILIKRDLEFIQNTVRHELQHAVQEYLKNIKNLKESGGLPSKKIRDPNVSPEGLSLQHERTDYLARDNEFYTELADNINNFKTIVQQYPKRIHAALFKTWIDQLPFESFKMMLQKELEISYPTQKLNEPNFIARLDYIQKQNNAFRMLKTQHPLKYNKSIKEFYKIVSDLI